MKYTYIQFRACLPFQVLKISTGNTEFSRTVHIRHFVASELKSIYQFFQLPLFRACAYKISRVHLAKSFRASGATTDLTKRCFYQSRMKRISENLGKEDNYRDDL